MAGKVHNFEEVANHNSKDDCWVIISGKFSRRSFTSADVTFFESTPYVSKTEQPSTTAWPPLPLPIPSSSIVPLSEPQTKPLQVYSHRRLHKAITPTIVADPNPVVDPSCSDTMTKVKEG